MSGWQMIALCAGFLVYFLAEEAFSAAFGAVIHRRTTPQPNTETTP